MELFSIWMDSLSVVEYSVFLVACAFEGIGIGQVIVWIIKR